MDKASFEQLLENHPPDIKAKGILLYNGVLQGKSAYQKEPIVSKLKDWKASEEALNDFIDSIRPQETNEKTYKGIPAVVEYLHSQGWKISLRTGYNHRDAKLLLPRKDGKYYQGDIDRYANSGILPRIDGTKPELSDANSDRKRKAEADSAEYDARIKKIKAEAVEGQYIEREIFEDEIAEQTLAFRNAIQTFIHASAEEIVSFVKGEASLIPDLIEFMLSRADEHFSKEAERLEAPMPAINIADIESDNLDSTDPDQEDNGNE